MFKKLIWIALRVIMLIKFYEQQKDKNVEAILSWWKQEVDKQMAGIFFHSFSMTTKLILTSQSKSSLRNRFLLIGDDATNE